MKKLLSILLAFVLFASSIPAASVFAASLPTLRSDTAKTLSMEQGKNYTFKFTASGTASASFTSGNSSVVAIRSCKKSGSSYFVTVSASGSKTGTTGVYGTLKGQKAVLQCSVTVKKGAPAPVGASDIDFIADGSGVSQSGDTVTIQYNSKNGNSTIPDCSFSIVRKVTDNTSEESIETTIQIDNTSVVKNNSNYYSSAPINIVNRGTTTATLYGWGGSVKKTITIKVV